MHFNNSGSPDECASTIAFNIDQENGNGSTETARVDDWLPMNSTHYAKWYYSTIHNVTAMVGAGVLSLPFAMAKLGWSPGVLVLSLSWFITLYTLWQMVEMHEGVTGKRFKRYYELGQHAFGKKWGLWIVVPQQLIVEVGTDIVFMVTGGQSLKNFHDLVRREDCASDRGVSLWILIFSSCHFVLAQLPNYNAIAGVSLAAAVMSFSYSTIAWVASLLHHQEHKANGVAFTNNVSYNYNFSCNYNVSTTANSTVSYNYNFSTTADGVFEVFNALGQVAFAYAGHNVVLEIQAMMPSTPEKRSKVPMWRGVLLAYIIVALCYFPVSLIGYWAFGNDVKDSILSSLKKPRWLIALANLMVVIHVIGSYQVYAMPVFDMLETVLVKKFHFSPSILLRLVARSTYVAFTCFVAITFPFFNELLGFFGGFALAPTTYFLPCIMWLRIYKPVALSPSWISNWVCIILGVILMFVSSIGGLRLIIDRAAGYTFYQ